ncbi:hypothetical protein QQP08_006775 [Theobroma cacao]|nr:hypothetical protein QQP08_006389 [Theobroma cacao]WRX14288.1 hypothetical protein QQP08_006775 [Theobroma cacao]
MQNQTLELFSILKQALIIPCQNTNFILLSFLASLPLLCFMLFHEMILHRTLIATSEIFRQPPAYFSHWLIPVNATRSMANDFSYKLIQLGLLHLLPLHLLELCAVVVSVDLTAKTYTKEKPTTPKEMIQRLLNKARCKGILLTSSYVYLVSTCFLLGLAGSERQGILLMLIFFTWGAGLRLVCFYGGCNKKDWTSLIQVCLICMGNVMKWMACVIHFYHRREHNLHRVDEEAGKQVEAVYEIF